MLRANYCDTRLDKNVFKDGLAHLQAKFEKRFYTTTLTFAHDLCEVIHTGINAETKPVVFDQPRFELIDASPTKHGSYAEARDRKRLGKRIIKSVQAQLEAALKAEADIISKPFADMQKELESMIENSLEIRKPFPPLSHAALAAQANEDVVMADADIAPGAAGQIDDGADKMDVDEPDTEVKDEEATRVNGESGPDAESETVPVPTDGVKPPPNGIQSAPTPPDTNGYVSHTHAPEATPLTPPQSNGSLGQGTDNHLTEGGIPWYLKPFAPEGTTAIEEQWAGRDAVRALSEELTDMDEAELNDLEFNVEDNTITASPARVSGGPAASVVAVADLPGGGLRSGSRRKAHNAAGTATKKKLRSSTRRR